ncbi:hypothetical protein ACFLY9_01615 [Patescibacteria group bacterium]
MDIVPLIFLFLVYNVVCFFSALLLFQKTSFFKGIKGILALIVLGIISSILHNLVYGLVILIFSTEDFKDEAVFFILSFLFWGSSIYLAIIIITSKVIQAIKGK